jgi:hypothetical protein
MSKASIKKRLRKAREQVNEDGTPAVPSPFNNILLQPVNSLVNLRGKEPKEQLANGQLLVKIEKFAIIPLEHYHTLLKLSKSKVKATDQQQAQLQQLIAARAKAEEAQLKRPTMKSLVKPTMQDIKNIVASKVVESDKAKEEPIDDQIIIQRAATDSSGTEESSVSEQECEADPILDK